MHVRGIWQDDKRFGMQVKVALATPVAPSGEAALMAYLKRVKHVGGARGGAAARALRRRRAGGDRSRPGGGVPLARLHAQARQRGDPVVERAALDALAAPAAGAARAGVAGAADRERYGRARGGADAAVRADERVRRGFHIADTIALRGIRRTRWRGGAVAHVLAEAEREGSTCLPVPDWRARRARSRRFVPDAALAMADAGQLVIEIDRRARSRAHPPGIGRAGTPRGGHRRRQPTRRRHAARSADDDRQRWCGPTDRSPRSSRPSWPRRSGRWPRGADATLEPPELAAGDIVPGARAGGGGARRRSRRGSRSSPAARAPARRRRSG